MNCIITNNLQNGLQSGKSLEEIQVTLKNQFNLAVSIDVLKERLKQSVKNYN